MKTMNNPIIIATNNQGKAQEFRELFKKLPGATQIKTLSDLLDVPNIIENGQTFVENATIKAQTIYQKYGQITIADDSGLVVDALGGRPGIYSARYAADHDDQANLKKVISEISPFPFKERSAHFITALVTVGPNGTMHQIGQVDGYILKKPQGKSGFGYDAIFYYPPLAKTFAQMTQTEKNSISHRGKAMKQLIAAWPQFIKGENNENPNM